MKNITEITRRDIFELFRDGYDECHYLVGKEKIKYHYWGRLNEVEFLKKLYPLDKISSTDERYDNAAEDIWQHSVNNDDWDSGWIFLDERFELLKGRDSVLLDFLCAVFHPENRYEKGYWERYLEKINSFLKADGYELYESDSVSNRSVYSWRKITPEEIARGGFSPFSVRNKQAIEKKTLKIPTISKKIRAELISITSRYDDSFDATTETGWNYTTTYVEETIQAINRFYPVKAFDSSGNYVVTNDISEFIMNNRPSCVLDAIELFERQIQDKKIAKEVNLLFQEYRLPYKLLGGKIEDTQLSVNIKEEVKEIGLKELLSQATELYRSCNTTDKQIAIEKLWDAFERLKTYYYGSVNDKKSSITKIIDNISNGNSKYKELFDKEFNELTVIGNSYRIRHHEMDKIEIIDNNYYDYLFQRCLALINLALKYLK